MIGVTALFTAALAGLSAGQAIATTPLITLTGEQTRGPKGRCYQTVIPNPVMDDVEFPSWINHSREDLWFRIECSAVDESTAVVESDTDATTMAKFFVVTYLSQFHIMDWTHATENKELMEMVNVHWETGSFQKSEDGATYDVESVMSSLV